MAKQFQNSSKSKKPSSKRKRNIILIVGIVIFLLLAVYDFPVIWNSSANFLNRHIKFSHLHQYQGESFRLGLDLEGGTDLLYQANTSNIAPSNQQTAMDGVNNVIVRRINLFGVAEPVVKTEKNGNNWRLEVQLAGVKNINQAISMIGQTPYLDFETQRSNNDTQQILNEQKNGQNLSTDPYFKPSGLDGSMLQSATLDFDPTTYKPIIDLQFNSKGTNLFGQLTQANIGKKIAIYLDGEPLSEPIVDSAILNGKAQITGNFTINQAKQLVTDLNAGALPVPISLISQNTVGASLGQDSFNKIVLAGIIGFILVILFMILYYRLAGLIASLALFVYAAVVLALYKVIPVTLTLSGIAGFVLSAGMAVDANILIFERMKEELRQNKAFNVAVSEGFKRAWTSIRDSNFSTLITSCVLYGIGQDFVKGFALTLGIGVLVSMFTAIIVSRNLLGFFIGSKFENNKYLWRR